MVLNNLKDTVLNMYNKYKFVFIIVLVGIALMLLPTKIMTKAENKITPAENSIDISIEEKLSSFLSLIDGAGEVRVILTVSEGEETIYQMDEKCSTGDNNSSIQSDTVTVNGADRSVGGLIKQVNPQIYLGAVVVCTGGSNPDVRLSIVEAVSKLTGLGANQISVLKMK